MATIAESLMLEVLQRLQTFSPEVAGEIRRDHRTIVTRDSCGDGGRVHLIDGDEVPDPKAKACYVEVTLDFTIAIFVRDDGGFAAADPIKSRVMAALDPTADAYPTGVTLKRGRIRSVQEIADADSVRVDMDFQFCYRTAEWSLEQ